jgi:hypothetical protein
MMNIDGTAVYILNIKTAQGNEVQLISADLYDFMQDQIGLTLSYQIPDSLLALQKKVPKSKVINNKVVLNEGSEQKDTWKHMYGCSLDFKTERDAYKAISQTCEYDGEIDIYLN